ncbi:MAG: hypothetical protein JWO90_152, partial [Solirubrobacterales bacterium]|nr:hypothetical protein [Solirubrobacterales bacterium]
LLCSRVPSGVVRGTDFGVAYVVEEAGGHRSRTLVRAEPDGSLTAIPEAPELFAADATVRLPPGAFLPALTGATEPGVEGDAAAAATLRGWLLAAQG